jgi:hypothetical protein
MSKDTLVAESRENAKGSFQGWKTPFSVFLWFFLGLAKRIERNTNRYAALKRAAILLQRRWHWTRRVWAARKRGETQPVWEKPRLRPWTKVKLWEIFAFFSLLILASMNHRLSKPARHLL